MEPLAAVQKILSHLPVDGHQPTHHDAGIIVDTLSNLTLEQLEALAVLASARPALAAMIETEVRSKLPPRSG